MKSEYFQTLVEAIITGSFSKAAEKLFVTQSAVSRRIQFLEEHYGFPLIDRSGPVLVPTEAGRIVMEKANKMIAIEKELVQDLHEYEHKTGVSFCCTPAFGIAYLPEIMKNFMLLYSSTSEMNFSFELPDKVIEGLREGIYQVGVIEHYERYDLSGFESIELPDDELIFVSSPILGIEEQEATIDQLINYDLYVRKEGCCSSKLLGFNMKNIGRSCTEFPRIIVCDDLHLIINRVCEGSGITFVSRSLVDQHIRQGILKEHRIPGFNHTHHRTLIVNNRSPSTPLLREFIAEILSAFGIASGNPSG
ncbi:MAG: LysR family transcriptional regulator [Desulfuromonadaceae bacterium]|nr:LysR family transcriptional regulator [Desulfuromonadaceae bacterium]